MQIDCISEIIPHLYLGTVEAATNKLILSKFQITHILCCAGELTAIYLEEYTYLLIAINNEPEKDMFIYFNKAKEFINEAISKQGNVLVHW